MCVCAWFDGLITALLLCYLAAGIAGATAGGFLCALSIAPVLMLDLCVNYVVNLFSTTSKAKKSASA
jgi:hypothetical protein